MTSNSNLSPFIVGDVDWMRNDYSSTITVGGVTYPSVEHAYQGSKFTDKNVQEAIANAQSVREARKIGRKSSNVRSNWDSIKYSTMLILLRQKFYVDVGSVLGSVLADRLIKTGTAPIVMNGYDSFWGNGDDGEGENKLGEALESIRAELQLISGVDPTEFDPKDPDEDEDEDEPVKAETSLLSDAILDGASQQLADACQDLFVGSVELLTLVDANDFDAGFISRRTGVSMQQAEIAIEKLRAWQSSVNLLKDLLDEDKEDEDLESDKEGLWEDHPSFEEDEEVDDEFEDDWLNSPD